MTSPLRLMANDPPADSAPVKKMPAAEWAWWLRDLEGAVGPIVSGRVYVIGARPSCGKTAVLMNIWRWLLGQFEDGSGDDWGEQSNVLSCWTERAKAAALTSLFSLIEDVSEDLTLREKWRQLPHGTRERIQRHREEYDLRRETYPVLDLACPSPSEIRDALVKYRPRVFILDYLQNVRPSGRESMFDAWRATMTHCTQYAAEGGTVIIGSQLKRKGDGAFDKYRPPFLEDFLGGGVIEAGANVALGLFRPLRRMSNAEERDVKMGHCDLSAWVQPGVMAIKVLKHTFYSDAADRMVRARVSASRRITDYSSRPVPEPDRGDAYEGDD